MRYEVGQDVEISEWSFNAPPSARGGRGTVIDISGSLGFRYVDVLYTVDVPEHGTLHLMDDDIKPLEEEDNGDMY